MLTGHQSQVVTLTLAYRALASYPAAYCIRKLNEHTAMCLLEGRGLVVYSGDNVPDNGYSTWTATELLRTRMGDLLAGKDVEAPISVLDPADPTVTPLRFRVGDRVVVSNPMRSAMSLKGLAGTVLSIKDQIYANAHGADYRIEVDNRTDMPYSVFDSELSPQPTLRFKVGDKVRVKHGYRQHLRDTQAVVISNFEANDGEMLTVTKIHENDSVYDYSLTDDGMSVLFVPSTWLEPIKPTTVEDKRYLPNGTEVWFVGPLPGKPQHGTIVASPTFKYQDKYIVCQNPGTKQAFYYLVDPGAIVDIKPAKETE